MGEEGVEIKTLPASPTALVAFTGQDIYKISFPIFFGVYFYSFLRWGLVYTGLLLCYCITLILY